MDRNTILAFALSMIVFMTYVMYQEQRLDDPGLGTQAQDVAEGSVPDRDEDVGPARDVGRRAELAREQPERTPSSSDETGQDAREMAPPEREIPAITTTLENDEIVAKISNDPAMITSWKLRDFMERLPDGEVPIELVNPDYPIVITDVQGVSGARFDNQRFEVIRESPREVVQRARNAAGVLTRTIRLDDEGYGFDLELAFESARVDPVDARFEVLIPAGTSERDDFRETSLVAYGDDTGITKTFVQGVGQPAFLGFGGSPDGKERIEGRSKWAGFDAHYFAGVLIDTKGRESLDVEFDALVEGESALARILLPGEGLTSGGVVVEKLRGFLGPKTADALESAHASLEKSVDRGWSWLEPLTRFFEIALDKLYIVIPNYGFAIIVLTIMVRIVTAPLMVRQMRSAERMREVQPRLKALQERYKDDRQKQSEEMMKLYREEGINPLGGCLPLFLQMPVLIGLFYALRTSIGLRHAPFILWIDDLSQPATLFTIPGIDFPVRLLPLIMAGSMYVQQKMMPQTGMDPVQARMMLIMMPGMMLLISYTFPSGLVLYWTVSNLLGIAHQYWVRNHLQRKS